MRLGYKGEKARQKQIIRLQKEKLQVPNRQELEACRATSSFRVQCNQSGSFQFRWKLEVPNVQCNQPGSFQLLLKLEVPNVQCNQPGSFQFLWKLEVPDRARPIKCPYKSFYISCFSLLLLSSSSWVISFTFSSLSG